MKIKKNIFVFLISIACYFAIAILRGQHYERIYGDISSAIAGFIILYLLTYNIMKRYKGQNLLSVLFLIWLGLSVVELPLTIFMHESMGTFLTYAFWCLGIAGGYFIWRVTKAWKIVVLAISLCIIYFIPCCIISYYHHNTGIITEQIRQ